MRDTMETVLNFKESDILFTNGCNDMNPGSVGHFQFTWMLFVPK